MTPNLLTLFAESSVALLYYMSVIVLSCAALFMALGQRLRGRAERAAGRYVLASLGITLAWIALMVGAVVVLINNQPAGMVMPPLDRAVGVLVVALAGWAFVATERRELRPPSLTSGWSAASRAQEPEPARRVFLSALVLLLVLGILGAYVYTATQWSAVYTPASEFNTSMLGTAWTLGGAALAAVMLLLLLLRIRTVVDVPLKLLFFLLILAGYLYTVFAIGTGQLRGGDSGALRLAFLAAMPLLPVVVYRLVVERLTSSIQERAAEATVSTLNTISSNLIDTPVERESMTLLKAIGTMLERENPDELPRQIVVAAATVLKADVTALLVADDPEYADVIAAYDSVQGRPIAAMALKLDEQPTLQIAIRERAQRALNTEQNLNELVDLYTRLDIQRVGSVYFQPLVREGEMLGVLVVALPYTQRDLRENERRLLESLSPVASRMLAISRAAQRARLEAQNRSVQAIVEGAQDTQPEPLPPNAARLEMQASLETARAQINELSALVRDLQIELDFERSRIAELAADDPEGMSITQRLERMSNERNQLEAERERLMQALQEAQTQLATASGDEDEIYGTMIRVLQKERDELQAQKEQLERQLVEIRSSGGQQAPAVLRDMLTRLSEEKARFVVERDQLKAQLNEVEAQLRALGIEGGPAGLAKMIVSLTEERSHYKVLAERATQDRDALVREIMKVKDRITAEAQRDARISALENEVKRLAHDNEVMMRQRDSLRQERDSLHNDRSEWEALRTRMLADLTALQTDLEEALFERKRIEAERNQLAEERTMLLAERDKLVAVRTALQTERDQLLARVEGNREILQKLGSEGVGQLQAMIDELTEERSNLEHEVLQLRNQVQRLREKLEGTNRKATRGDTQRDTRLDTESVEVMLSVAQELRTPLGPINVYADMLLSETVGILNELQRQFLQRIKANGDRLAELVEDFIRVVAIDTGQLNLKMMPVDMGEIIEDAITATRTQFREKGITLKLELPDSLPPIVGDRGALQQVVVELLSNAYRASPTDGEVLVSARFEPHFRWPTRDGAETGAETADVVLLSVRDFGGGVPPEEQARVFSRLYRADNPLVQGLGDTGVGLSIARALTEGHNGRIWLESEAGTSSTFTLAIPVQAQRETRAEYVAS